MFTYILTKNSLLGYYSTAANWHLRHCLKHCGLWLHSNLACVPLVYILYEWCIIVIKMKYCIRIKKFFWINMSTPILVVLICMFLLKKWSLFACFYRKWAELRGWIKGTLQFYSHCHCPWFCWKWSLFACFYMKRGWLKGTLLFYSHSYCPLRTKGIICENDGSHHLIWWGQ